MISIGAYVVTFLISIPICLLGLSDYRDIIMRNEVIHKASDILVQNYGYFLFTLLYLGQMVFYQMNRKIPNAIVVRFFTNYAINTIVFIAVNEWFFGLLIFDRINVLSNGHCTSGEKTNDYLCHESGYEWIGGFDSSGHLYFLSSISLMLIAESLNTFRLQSSYLRKYFLIVSSSFLIMWYFEFVITSLFFHTIPEKCVGLLVGMIVPLLFYDFPSRAQLTSIV